MKKLYVLIAALTTPGLGLAQSASQQFTSSGTFTVPAGITSVTIEVIGAGGDGGVNGGGGGGGGGYAKGIFSVTPGTNLTVHIGQHGVSSVIGTTYAGSLISASGGVNGGTGGAATGGNPGTGTGGSINNTGGAGGFGTDGYFGGGGGGAAGPVSNGAMGGSAMPYTGSCLTAGGNPGNDGGGYAGAGGKGAGFNDDSCSMNNAATNGSLYGGGGGGGNGNGSMPGEGANGFCIISWCMVDVSTTVTGSTVTANTTMPVSFQWIDCSTQTPISGETGASYTATIDGDYAVIISDGSCVDTSACVSLVGVGLNEIETRNTHVYPNPFSSKINVEGTYAGEIYTLMHVHGQMVWKGKDISKQDFTALVPGVYMLKIETATGIMVKKLVKE